VYPFSVSPIRGSVYQGVVRALKGRKALKGRACFHTLYIFSKPEKDKCSKRLRNVQKQARPPKLDPLLKEVGLSFSKFENATANRSFHAYLDVTEAQENARLNFYKNAKSSDGLYYEPYLKEWTIGEKIARMFLNQLITTDFGNGFKFLDNSYFALLANSCEKLSSGINVANFLAFVGDVLSEYPDALEMSMGLDGVPYTQGWGKYVAAAGISLGKALYEPGPSYGDIVSFLDEYKDKKIEKIKEEMKIVYENDYIYLISQTTSRYTTNYKTNLNPRSYFIETLNNAVNQINKADFSKIENGRDIQFGITNYLGKIINMNQNYNDTVKEIKSKVTIG